MKLYNEDSITFNRKRIMKKLFILPVCLLALAACNGGKSVEEKAQQERDSLMQVIDEKENELNAIAFRR